MKFTTFAIAMTSLVSSTSALLPILNKEMTNLFNAWKTQFAHTFDSVAEEEKHLLVFIKNAEMIIKHNKKFATGEVSYDLSLNHYAHLTWAEFKASMTTQFKKPANHVSHAKYTHEAPNMRNLAAFSVDWRAEGAVTPVKNQGECGSCWTFSTTGAIEGAHFIKTGELISLSEQQILNCAGNGWGCDGGFVQDGFEYVHNVGGIVSESDMPYKKKRGKKKVYKCDYEVGNYSGDKSEFVASIKGYVDVEENSEAALASALSQQPVSVNIDASDPTFQFYKSGVYDPDTCCEDRECTDADTDHAVLAVGYGSDSFGEYWIVKNSWGKKWGDKGFVKMIKGKGGKCGITSGPHYPIV